MKYMRGFYLNTTLKKLSKTSSNAPYKLNWDNIRPEQLAQIPILRKLREQV